MKAIPDSSLSAFIVYVILIACILCTACPVLLGQDRTQTTLLPHQLITQPVDELRLATLKGNTHPLARREFDQGPAPASLPLERMLLVLKRSPEQEASLLHLLDEQQDKASPRYHQWLTPEEFGKQFGPTDADLRIITIWLQSHGFQVGATKGRTVLEFSGTAGQLQAAFHTTIHKYLVNGEQHWANDRDPSIPTALTSAVAGIDSLHDFPKKPLHRLVKVFSQPRNSGDHPVLNSRSATPSFTVGANCGLAAGPCYAMSPYDLATIYNVLPLWNGTSPIDGTGQTIAIVSQSDIYPQDFSDFRQDFGLPAGNLNIIYNGSAPNKLASEGDELESDLDVQWSGAVAKGATIDLVESIWTNTTAGVDLSALYIVDNNIAPILSESYGACELDMGTAGNQFYNQIWQQAAAQGISVFVSTGDSGAAVCDRNSPIATQGLSVNGIASTPYNVAVGGTDFADLYNQSAYWNSTNDPVTLASAKGYVPESTWNDTCTNSEFFSFTGDTTAEQQCNDTSSQFWPGFLAPVGGSGGASNCITSTNGLLSSCGGGYEKPTWQTGPGVPNDGTRDLPDVSLFAADGMNSSFYLACETDIYGGCSGDPYNMVPLGGTSASAPAFAGIMAMINQKMQSRQGNPNYVLYALAAQPSASCDSTGTIDASCVFYDVTAGTISMSCPTGTPNCVTNTAGDANGVLAGYATTTGYDLATGLGSVNVANLVNSWSTVGFRPTISALSMSPTTLTHGSSASVNITVSPASGTGAPSGMASLVTSTGIPAGLFTVNNGVASGDTDLLPGGQYTVTAHYAGDGTFAASDSSPGVAVTVDAEPSITTLQAFTLDQNGNSIPFTTGPYGGAIVYLSANVAGKSGHGVPTGKVNLTQTLNGTTTNFPGDPFPLNSQAVTMLPFPGYNWWAYSPGAYTMGASYNGDGSFKKSTAPSVSFTITPAQTNTTISIAGCTPVNGFCYGVPGENVVIFAFVNYSGAAFTGGVFINQPTGTVTFYSNGTPIGPPVPVDSSINPPVASINTSQLLGVNTLTAQYSGDSNFAASTSSSLGFDVGVTFGIAVSPGTITVPSPGQSGSTTLTLTPQNGFTGPITLNCASGMPPGSTCSFSPNPVQITGPSSVSTVLTVTTTPIGQMQHRVLNGRRNVGWVAAAVVPLLGLCLIGVPAGRRMIAVLPALLLVALLLFVPSCGGGGGGIGGPPQNPVPSISSLSPTQLAAGSQSQTLTIHGSGFMNTSTLTYNSVAHAAVFVSSNQLTTSLSAADLANLGDFSVVVTNPAPGGGASSPATFDVVTGTPTGTFTVIVNAASGPFSQSATFTLTVQ